MPPLSFIEQLTLTDFRNYTSQRLEISAPFVVLVGPNGAGKTNILEALSLFAPGRGLRRAPFEDLARHGAKGWAVAMRLRCDGLPALLGTAWGDGRGKAGSSRQTRIDGASQKSPGAFAPYLHPIWVTPSMDRLFSGPAQDRRRFLDRLALAHDTEHTGRTATFDKLTQERNKLLEEGGGEDRWLTVLEEKMAQTATIIATTRRATLRALQEKTSPPHGTPSCFPSFSLSLSGEFESRLDGASALDVEDGYAATLRAMRGKDRAAKRTLIGPHRTDLSVVHSPKNLAAPLCSTGEQKALLLGILLSHGRVLKTLRFSPLLLLDEGMSHLDHHRRQGLFQELETLGAQTWLTGTDAYLFDSCPQRDLFFIQDGKIV